MRIFILLFALCTFSGGAAFAQYRERAPVPPQDECPQGRQIRAEKSYPSTMSDCDVLDADTAEQNQKLRRGPALGSPPSQTAQRPPTAGHPLGWVSCEFKWQEAGKPSDYHKFMNECIEASQEKIRSEAAPRGEKQSSTQPQKSILPDSGSSLSNGAITQTQTQKQGRTYDQNKIASLLDRRDPASSALDEITSTMGNLDSKQLASALENNVSLDVRPSTDKDSKLYFGLGNCASSAVGRGSRSPVAMLQNDCASEYRAWFPYCVQTRQPAKTCAIIALFLTRAAIEGYEQHCVGATAEDASRFECAGKPSISKKSNATAAFNPTLGPMIIAVVVIVSFGLALVTSPVLRKVSLAVCVVAFCVWMLQQLLKDQAGKNRSDDEVQAEASTITDSRNVQWDPKKAIQNERVDRSIGLMQECARNGATLALRTGVRNRDQVGSAVLSTCQTQMWLYFREANAAGISQENQRSVATAVLDNEIDSVVRLGR